MKPSLSIKWIFSVAAVLALTSTLSGFNKVQSEETDLVIKPVKTIQVPELAELNYDSFIANIDATERASLSFQVSGEVELIPVRMGQEVRKGELLAKLDPTDYQVAMDAAKAQYELSKSQYERSKELFSKKLISTDSHDQAKNAYTAADVAYQQAATNLGYTKLYAPYDGVVSMVFSKQSQIVADKQTVLNIVDDKQMDATFSIPVSKLQTQTLNELSGSTMWVVMDSHQSIQIPAVFKEISTQPNQDTNSYQAIVSIDQVDGINLLPGMTAQVNISRPNQDLGLVLTESAWINKSETEGELWMLQPNDLTVSKIKVSLNQEGQVIGGVSAGDQLVVAGANTLVEGQKVTTWKREGGI